MAMNVESFQSSPLRRTIKAYLSQGGLSDSIKLQQPGREGHEPRWGCLRMSPHFHRLAAMRMFPCFHLLAPTPLHGPYVLMSYVMNFPFHLADKGGRATNTIALQKASQHVSTPLRKIAMLRCGGNRQLFKFRGSPDTVVRSSTKLARGAWVKRGSP